MDIVGPLAKTKKGNRFILTIVDDATRYPEAFALKSCDAESVANALIELFSRVGIPKVILTDQGTNFTSKLIKELFTLLKVKGVTISPYHPQANGKTERFNGTLKSMLRSFAQLRSLNGILYSHMHCSRTVKSLIRRRDSQHLTYFTGGRSEDQRK